MKLYPSAISRSKTDLLGRSVLLVEDDFCQARDAQQALQHAGARVLGPFSEPLAALRCIAARDPSCAIIDIRLGDEVRFSVAQALRDKEIPFLFMTGLSPGVIPEDLRDAPVFQKPVDYRAMMSAAARISGGRWR